MLRAQSGSDRIRISGTVRDSVSGVPVPGAIVDVVRGAGAALTVHANIRGQYEVLVAAPGPYRLTARQIGYQPTTRIVDATPATLDIALDVKLAHAAVSVQGMAVTASPVSIDVATGDQTYQVTDTHAAPTTTTSQVVQQAIAGAARAPTGEVHIRGQHAEYTYYIDGVPVPAGISGSLNELFDPEVADRIDFQTGGWDAQYGNKNIAVIDVTTRIPQGGFHGEASGYGGSFNGDGQTFLATTNSGPFGFLASGTRQETAMRLEPVVGGAGNVPENFHNFGLDQFGFAKMSYTPSSRDQVTLDVNGSRTHFLIPFDSGAGIINDQQTDVNDFANLGWRHTFSDSTAAGRASPHPFSHDVFSAVYVRRGTLDYVPGAEDQPSFLFYPDTENLYSVRESRSATTVGVLSDYTLPLSSAFTVKAGIDASLVRGREDFNTIDSLQRAGPSVNGNIRGGDAGAYLQSVYDFSPQWELRAGVRLDHHVAPLAGDQHGVSPRVRLNWFPDANTSAFVYYGRLFIPSNVEDFHVLAIAGDSGEAGQPTYPARDNRYEGGITHRFDGGVVAKFAAYHQDDSPALDDNTLPGTAITTDVNLAQVHVSGLETAVEVHPGGELSGYVNAALSHAIAHGPVTGGFFPTDYPVGWFDQDHDQRLSIALNANYAPRWGYLSATGIFGSGLTNGNPEGAVNRTGLFDFNPAIKVAPSFILNLAAGTGPAWKVGGVSMRPELFVDNALDRRYILKGAFTSGASVGRPRTVELRMDAAW